MSWYITQEAGCMFASECKRQHKNMGHVAARRICQFVLELSSALFYRDCGELEVNGI